MSKAWAMCDLCGDPKRQIRGKKYRCPMCRTWIVVWSLFPVEEKSNA